MEAPVSCSTSPVSCSTRRRKKTKLTPWGFINFFASSVLAAPPPLLVTSLVLFPPRSALAAHAVYPTIELHILIICLCDILTRPCLFSVLVSFLRNNLFLAGRKGRLLWRLSSFCHTALPTVVLNSCCLFPTNLSKSPNGLGSQGKVWKTMLQGERECGQKYCRRGHGARARGQCVCVSRGVCM